jgi:two-component sensor histidine kinase
MSLLYDKLYRSPDFEALPVRDYLPSLVDEILSGFSGGAAVRVEKRVDDFVLGAATLQPLGIIVNELLTNIMKYAFAGRAGGRVRLSAGIEGDRVTVAVEDDGVGMPLTVDFGKSTGFGLTLVEALTEQLGGQVRIERDMGTRIVLQFDR